MQCIYIYIIFHTKVSLISFSYLTLPLPPSSSLSLLSLYLQPHPPPRPLPSPFPPSPCGDVSPLCVTSHQPSHQHLSDLCLSLPPFLPPSFAPPLILLLHL